MNPSWGQLFYRAGCILAALIIVLTAFNYFYNVGEGLGIIPLTPLALAGIIWLIGYACRKLFAA